jgi:hypothetical protein
MITEIHHSMVVGRMCVEKDWVDLMANSHLYTLGSIDNQIQTDREGAFILPEYRTFTSTKALGTQHCHSPQDRKP